ncbi:unnamed protein product [Clavelina lepadiformis]|uniref:Hydantoinase B/oxoprolinase domain-containing protein n=1 Tax=Clavelina lepadiformis TaxID=159417 RepID=A0ABP0G7Y8_CLALP
MQDVVQYQMRAIQNKEGDYILSKYPWAGGLHLFYLTVITPERLDFSCALFGPDGGLVSNAPHIPVHLGAMQDAVQKQMWAIEINEGDCIVSNHPSAGGVHLPDLIK